MMNFKWQMANESVSALRRKMNFRWAGLVLLAFVTWMGCSVAPAKAQMPKKDLFQVDITGVAFNELRCSYTWRVKGGWFGYVAPNFYYDDVRKVGQQYYGLGCRGAVRKYIVFRKQGKLPPDKLPPVGMFLQGGGHYRFMHLKTIDPNTLDIGPKTGFHQAGVWATIGKQWTWGAWNRDLCFSGMAGVEYLFHFFPAKNGFEYNDTHENWYQFPFSWKPQFLNGFRLYAGIEVGFALREQHRHW